MPLIILLNTSPPSWGQRSMPDKELSSWAIKMQLDCYKDVVATTISTLVFTSGYKLIGGFVPWGIGTAVVNTLIYCSRDLFHWEHKNSYCCSRQTTIPIHRSSPLTLDTSGCLEKSSGRRQSCSSLSSDCSQFPVTGMTLWMKCFPWTSPSSTDPIICWIWCPEARSSTAELPVMREATFFYFEPASYLFNLITAHCLLPSMSCIQEKNNLPWEWGQLARWPPFITSNGKSSPWCF